MLGVSGSNHTPGKTFFFSIFILRIYFENLKNVNVHFQTKIRISILCKRSSEGFPVEFAGISL